MSSRLLAATALATVLACPAAMADQYVVQISGPFAAASAGLRNSLQIDEIDTFTHDGELYVVLGAPTEGFLEAYFYAVSHTPRALNTLGADWTAPGLAGLTLEQRLLFLTPAYCEFCAP